MTRSDNKFNIPFIGLKIGVHRFEYEVEDTFFEDYEYSLVQGGSVKVLLELEKKETMLQARFSLAGTVQTDCDRCTAALELEIKGSYQLVYTFGLEDSEDESLIVLHPDEYQINVKDAIYELITVSIPIRKIHPAGQCDEAMWNLVKEYTINSGDDDDDFDEEEDDDDNDPDDDPKWTILKNLN